MARTCCRARGEASWREPERPREVRLSRAWSRGESVRCRVVYTRTQTHDILTGENHFKTRNNPYS